MSDRDNSLVWILGLGGIAAYVLLNQNQVSDFADDASSVVTATLFGWQQAGSGPQWVPVLNAAEQSFGLPQNLLARIAYQESSFIESIIRGIRKSGAGAMGIMQMMPQYFQSVNAPVPYSDTDVQAQINEAAQQMVSLYNSTQDWGLALAAYNAGLGNVQKYGGIPPFAETQNYVSKILADLPGLV